MNKSELVNWLQEEHEKWEALLDEIGPTRMDQPGVNGDWSMKDMVAHLNGWNRWLLARLEAARRGEPEAPTPWPAHLKTEDEVNAWIYESSRGRSASEVLDETRRVFQELVAVVEDLPYEVRIEEVRGNRAYYLVWVGNKRFPVGEFFDHYHDDHEPDVRAWLAREEGR
jgi:hypothetical protein